MKRALTFRQINITLSLTIFRASSFVITRAHLSRAAARFISICRRTLFLRVCALRGSVNAFLLLLFVDAESRARLIDDRNYVLANHPFPLITHVSDILIKIVTFF